jgi:hypothetical protein
MNKSPEPKITIETFIVDKKENQNNLEEEEINFDDLKNLKSKLKKIELCISFEFV